MTGLAWVAGLVLMLGAVDASPKVDCGVLAGWSQEGPAREIEPDTLFDYMNGNAEGYLVYGFTRMDGVTCRSGEDRIIIDVSEMSDPEFAYGMFSANRDMRRPIESIGMGGQVTERRAVFVKGSYYVELAAQTPKDHSATLRAYVKAIEQTFEGRVTPPDALGWFPKEGLDADSVRLIPESVLGVRQLSSGYVGRYDLGEAFVVSEATADDAAELMATLQSRWGASRGDPIMGTDEVLVARDKYLGGLLVFRKGTRVAGIVRLAEGVDGTTLAARLAKTIP